jgi:hypothetical protein
MNARLSAAIAFASAILVLPGVPARIRLGSLGARTTSTVASFSPRSRFAGADANALRDGDPDVSRALVSGLRVSSSGAECGGHHPRARVVRPARVKRRFSTPLCSNRTRAWIPSFADESRPPEPCWLS